MEPQKPAEGILKRNDWGDSKNYFVHCDCTDADHAHTIEVEADFHSVQVIIYSKSHSRMRDKSRWKQIWQLLTKGYVDVETSIILKEQVALNYADTLVSAVKDVKEFKEKYSVDNKKNV